jgi:hypothetical protein
VFERLKARVRAPEPEPAGPPEAVRVFGLSDRPITESGVSVDGDAWRIQAEEPGSVPLFEVTDPNIDKAMLTYRAELKTEAVQGGAYLEMWCRFPGRGEFLSKGLQQKVKGTTGWASYEVPFYLKAGERPDLIRLNVAFEGAGAVWLRNPELLRTPLR